jgi:hypothetical protein
VDATLTNEDQVSLAALNEIVEYMQEPDKTFKEFFRYTITGSSLTLMENETLALSRLMDIPESPLEDIDSSVDSISHTAHSWIRLQTAYTDANNRMTIVDKMIGMRKVSDRPSLSLHRSSSLD